MSFQSQFNNQQQTQCGNHRSDGVVKTSQSQKNAGRTYTLCSTCGKFYSWTDQNFIQPPIIVGVPARAWGNAAAASAPAPVQRQSSSVDFGSEQLQQALLLLEQRINTNTAAIDELRSLIRIHFATNQSPFSNPETGNVPSKRTHHGAQAFEETEEDPA
jgi:hypothetical protein